MFCVIPLFNFQKQKINLAQARYLEYNLSNCSNLHLVGSSKFNSILFTNSAIKKHSTFKYINLSENAMPLLNKMEDKL